jgi:hypothetical protein
VNLTEGGRYGFAMTPPDGEPFHLSGEPLEIDPLALHRNGWTESFEKLQAVLGSRT